jgi:SAM-dependent methyltransferase
VGLVHHGAVDPADVTLLLEPAGRQALEAATEAVARRAEPLAVVESLRRSGVDPSVASLAVTQAVLRARARPRFGADADRMLWTDAGLEQATRATVAEHRSRRFSELGVGRVADLCCGVGGDLLALLRAGRHRVLGVDADPVTAALAAANVAALGLAERAEVLCADVREVDLAGIDAAFVDPGRRTASGRRTFDPDAYSPPYSFVAALSAQVPATAAKVAPGIPHELVAGGAEAEWVSDHGEVKEATLWHGPFAGMHGAARRRATLLPAGASVVDDPALGTPAVGPLARWLHEPDGAVVRAGLVGEVAVAIGAHLVDPAIAYLTTDDAVASPFTTAYEVDAVLPFQLKRLRAALRERGAGDVVVKKRGSAVDPEDLRRRLRLDGEGPTWTVLLTRLGDDPVAVLSRTVRPSPG